MATTSKTGTSRRRARNAGPTPDKDLYLRIFQVMALHRAVEDRMVSMYRQGEMLGSVYTGHWHEAIAVGTAAALRAGRLPLPDPPGPRRAPVARDAALAGDGELPGQGHLADRRARRHPALRPAGPEHLQPAQPHPGQLPGGHRRRVRVQVPRRGPAWRSRTAATDRPRAATSTRRSTSRRCSTCRASSSSRTTSSRTRRRCGCSRAPTSRQGGGVRHPGREGRRHRRDRGLRGDGAGRHPGPRRRGPVADRGGDHAHARPRRARPGRLRAAGDVRGVGREGPGGAIAAAQLQELGVATDDEVADDARAGPSRKAIEARKKSLGDPMPVPDREEERVYA